MKNFTTVLKIAPAFLLASSMMHAQIKDSTTKEKAIEEVVLVGYGSKKKSDLTGSVTSVTEKDFNKGAIVSADQLLMGKAPGVRITSTGGSPNAAPNILIRGGGSLSASNQPLIVIDGVPIALDNPAGINNPLLLVNPNDIESFSILKDASATAIYGSRASAGVILITTKKGTSGKAKFNYSGNISYGEVYNKLNVMSSDEFVKFITEKYPNQAWKLGVGGNQNNPTTAGTIYNTNWQDEVLRNSISTDHTFGASANLFKKIPFRGSFGYNRTEGVVINNDLERYTASLKFTPLLLDKHLKIDINGKGILVKQNAIDEGSVLGGAVSMDPTKPVYSVDGGPGSTRFGEFYQTLALNSLSNQYEKRGGNNPVADLYQRFKPQETKRFLGNAEFDYKLHFLPELRAVVNLGLDYSQTNISESFSDNAISQYELIKNAAAPNEYFFNGGKANSETQIMRNRLLDAYLVYNKKSDNSLITNLQLQGGYSYQNITNDGSKELSRINTDTRLREFYTDINSFYYNDYNLQSFIGRANIDFVDRYLFTLSFRSDASSLFAKDDRWGYFPAVAFAWKASSEEWMKNANLFSELKLRLGWGMTGQQNIMNAPGVGYYPSRPLFALGSSTGQYLPGYSTYSANPFNPLLTWEKATTYNVGIDFTSKGKKLSGTIDFYQRTMDDLLAFVTYPAGQFLTNEYIQNSGRMKTEGVELSLNYTPIKTNSFTWELNGNISYNNNIIEDLGGNNLVRATSDANLPSGTGSVIRYHSIGYQAASALVYEQVYDSNGQPLQSVFVDRNQDGIINSEDKYFLEIAPKYTFGFGTSMYYKNWDLTAGFHGQIGGKVHNSRKLSQGFTSQALSLDGLTLTNVMNFYDNASSWNLTSQPNDEMQLSDYFYEDASFLRCDNITLGYNFKSLFGLNNVRFYGSVNNAFIITKYTGQDPESPTTFDNNFYPRPRIYTFGVNLNF